jgi:DNA-binding LacI/PurR family transcriptional regulator
MSSESPPPRRLSIRDLARHLGLSHATVSLALRDHPRISKKTKELVKKNAEELGYHPDPMLAALTSYRLDKKERPVTAVIAWLNAWSNGDRLRAHREFDLYWEGASAAALKLGYRLEEFRLNKDFSPERVHQILSTRGIRGILLPPHQPDSHFGSFPWEEYSIVRFGRSLSKPLSHLVTADQVANGVLAFRKCRELGYKRIGFVTNEENTLARGHQFEAGFLLAQRTVPAGERLEIFGISDIPNSGRAERLKEWVESEKPDAILTDNADLPKVLRRAGIAVPRDVGLAVTTVLDVPNLAGIHQNPMEIGRVGMLMLNSLINEGAKGFPAILRQILVEGNWQDGDSLPPKSIKPVSRSKRKS